MFQDIKLLFEYMFSVKSFVWLHRVILLLNFSWSAYWVYLSNHRKTSSATLESNIITAAAAIKSTGLQLKSSLLFPQCYLPYAYILLLK